ncbi:MAG: hypothetical protein FJ360_02560 [Thaumarchaeota archaeon]|nr:hypothetical protein [Nitrososphaerota archaeon]
MRNDQRFEIERAFDLLPHIVGASWAVIWFRLNSIKRPTRQEFREKVIEYFNLLNPLFETYPKTSEFSELVNYIKMRKNEEIEKIVQGKNTEVEKRFDRYIDYG